MALVARVNQNSYFRRITLLKKLFWLYFLLLMFEGALRKWVAPQLSAPLLVVRDPVSLMIVWEAYRTAKWPSRWTAPIALLTVLLAGLFILQIIVGGNPLLVGLFGLRSYLLPFPVIFIMAENMDGEDLRRFARCTLWLLLPMTALEVAQYLSPGSSFLNRGAYEGGSQIDYVGGHVRASGTFSFVAGAESYAALAGAFVFYGMITPGIVKTWTLWAGVFALMLSIPFLGSRTVVAQLAAMIVCMGLGAIMGISQFGKVLRVILPVGAMAILVSFLPVFSEGFQSMTQRFTGATAIEGGTAGQSVIDRTIMPAVRAIESAYDSDNWMGLGIGRGAVAVQAFLTGSTMSVAGEDEFSHELLEMGPIAGMGFILFKLFLGISLFGMALNRAREGESLPLLLISLTLSMLFFTLPEQPTAQGFAVMSMALCIAAARMSVKSTEQPKPSRFQRQELFYGRRVQKSLR